MAYSIILFSEYTTRNSVLPHTPTKTLHFWKLSASDLIEQSYYDMKYKEMQGRF